MSAAQRKDRTIQCVCAAAAWFLACPPASAAPPATAPSSAPAPSPSPPRAPRSPRQSVTPQDSAQRPPIEPNVHPTWLWAATQLVPSPQWTFSERRSPRFGVRWQVTPFLYSLGIRRGLRPFRFFVVEPNARHSGSLELFLSPEYAISPGPFEHGLLGRAGARLYVPLAHNGEYLSCSAGASAFVTHEGAGGAIEIGLYTFAGTLGIQVTHTPAPATRATTLTLNVRYF